MDNVSSNIKSSGAAATAIRKMTELADKYKINVTGAAWGGLGTGTPEEKHKNLKRWYARHGFEVDIDDPEENFMVRYHTKF